MYCVLASCLAAHVLREVGEGGRERGGIEVPVDEKKSNWVLGLERRHRTVNATACSSSVSLRRYVHSTGQ